MMAQAKTLRQASMKWLSSNSAMSTSKEEIHECTMPCVDWWPVNRGLKTSWRLLTSSCLITSQAGLFATARTQTEKAALDHLASSRIWTFTSSLMGDCISKVSQNATFCARSILFCTFGTKWVSFLSTSCRCKVLQMRLKRVFSIWTQWLTWYFSCLRRCSKTKTWNSYSQLWLKTSCSMLVHADCWQCLASAKLQGLRTSPGPQYTS